MDEYMEIRVRILTCLTEIAYTQDSFHTHHLEHVDKLNTSTFPVKKHSNMSQVKRWSHQTISILHSRIFYA